MSALLAASAALAHVAPPSQLEVDFAAGAVVVDFQLPMDQLGMALAGDARAAPPDVPGRQAELAAYVLDHIALSAGERTLSASMSGLAAGMDNDHAVLTGRITFPEPDRHETLTLTADLIRHEVVSHRIVVNLDGEPAGTLRYGTPSVVLTRPRSSLPVAPIAVLLGVLHGAYWVRRAWRRQAAIDQPT